MEFLTKKGSALDPEDNPELWEAIQNYWQIPLSPDDDYFEITVYPQLQLLESAIAQAIEKAAQEKGLNEVFEEWPQRERPDLGPSDLVTFHTDAGTVSYEAALDGPHLERYPRASWRPPNYDSVNQNQFTFDVEVDAQDITRHLKEADTADRWADDIGDLVEAYYESDYGYISRPVEVTVRIWVPEEEFEDEDDSGEEVEQEEMRRGAWADTYSESFSNMLEDLLGIYILYPNEMIGELEEVIWFSETRPDVRAVYRMRPEIDAFDVFSAVVEEMHMEDEWTYPHNHATFPFESMLRNVTLRHLRPVFDAIEEPGVVERPITPLDPWFTLRERLDRPAEIRVIEPQFRRARREAGRDIPDWLPTYVANRFAWALPNMLDTPLASLLPEDFDFSTSYPSYPYYEAAVNYFYEAHREGNSLHDVFEETSQRTGEGGDKYLALSQLMLDHEYSHRGEREWLNEQIEEIVADDPNATF